MFKPRQKNYNNDSSFAVCSPIALLCIQKRKKGGKK